MNCRTCHYELSQCLDARLPSGRRALVMQHVAECERCARFWTELQAARELALRLQRHRTGPDFREQLFARIQTGEGTPPAVFQEHVPVAAKIRYALTGAATAAAALLVFTLTRAGAPKTAPTTDSPIAATASTNGGNLNVRRPRGHEARPDGFAAAADSAMMATPLPATTDVLALETARRFQSHVVWARANSLRIENNRDESTMRLAWDNTRNMRLYGKVLQELQTWRQMSFADSEMKVELDRLIAQLDRVEQPSPEALRGVLPVLRDTPRLAEIVSQVTTRPGTPPEQQQLVLQRISLDYPDVFQTMLPTVSVDEFFDFNLDRIRTFQGQCGQLFIIIGGPAGFSVPQHH